MKSTKVLTTTVMLICFFSLSFTPTAKAQVTVVRGGNENPMISVAKSTFYGALTGLLVGGALVLATKADNGDIMRWSFVGGVFGGLAIGLYHVANRPGPSNSILQFNTKGLRKAQLPKPVIRLSRKAGVEINVPLMSFSL